MWFNNYRVWKLHCKFAKLVWLAHVFTNISKLKDIWMLLNHLLSCRGCHSIMSDLLIFDSFPLFTGLIELSTCVCTHAKCPACLLKLFVLSILHFCMPLWIKTWMLSAMSINIELLSHFNQLTFSCTAYSRLFNSFCPCMLLIGYHKLASVRLNWMHECSTAIFNVACHCFTSFWVWRAWMLHFVL